MAVSKRLRFEVLKRDNNTCRYCGGTAPDVKLTIDHVVPSALGGDDDPSNLVAACSDCNSGKSSSNPDAPLVANVAADALRWAQAQQTAARQMVEDLGRRQESAKRFKAEWDRWTFGGHSVDLPDGWQSSVENFLAAGLPMEVLVDCIAKAMANPKIRFNNMFRYMCGIGWTRVRELNEAAKSFVSNPVAKPPAMSEQYEQAMALLYGYIGGMDDPSLRVMWAEAFDAAREEDEDEHGEPVDYSGWSQEVKAAVWALIDHVDRGYAAAAGISYALSMVPEEEKQRYLDEARRGFLKANETEYTTDDLHRYAVILIFRKFYPQPATKDAWS